MENQDSNNAPSVLVLNKSLLGTISDPQLAEQLNISRHVVLYWRQKWGISSYEDSLAKERQEMFDKGFHWCSKCKQYKPLDFFGKSSKEAFGLKTPCKTCRAEYIQANKEALNQRQKESYAQNRVIIRKRQAEYNNRNRAERNASNKVRHNILRVKYVSMFGTKCSRCGYCEFLSGLEFHHVNPDEKDATPVTVIASGNHDRIVKELDKCCLLCRNCHMAFHAGEWSAEFIKSDGIGWMIAK